MLISLNFPSFVSILQSKPLTSSADNLTPANEDYNNIFSEQKIDGTLLVFWVIFRSIAITNR